MIQAVAVSAIPGRDDVVTWPYLSGIQVQASSAVRRMLIVCSRDGFADVRIDSNNVPSAYSFAEAYVVRGMSTLALAWQPGNAIGTLFDQSGRWLARAFLFDDVHVNGIPFGRFYLDVELQ